MTAKFKLSSDVIEKKNSFSNTDSGRKGNGRDAGVKPAAGATGYSVATAVGWWGDRPGLQDTETVLEESKRLSVAHLH